MKIEQLKKILYSYEGALAKLDELKRAQKQNCQEWNICPLVGGVAIPISKERGEQALRELIWDTEDEIKRMASELGIELE